MTWTQGGASARKAQQERWRVHLLTQDHSTRTCTGCPQVDGQRSIPATPVIAGVCRGCGPAHATLLVRWQREAGVFVSQCLRGVGCCRRHPWGVAVADRRLLRLVVIVVVEVGAVHLRHRGVHAGLAAEVLLRVKRAVRQCCRDATHAFVSKHRIIQVHCPRALAIMATASNTQPQRALEGSHNWCGTT